MKVGRPVLLAILVYVTLDLSSPAMPGAFVFEPGDSVESLGRGRAVATMLAAPVPVPDPSPVAPLRVSDLERPTPRLAAPAPAPRRLPPPRTAVEPSPLSEDPH